MTRAKFKVDSAKKFNDTPESGGTVTLSAVYSTDPNHENKRFWDATPSGSINLSINNPKGFATFEQGREYYVDFTPA